MLYALVVSLLLHLLFVLVINLPKPLEEPEERLIEVSLQPPVEKQKKIEEALPVIKNQMITPPDLKESPTPPLNTNLLSDKNTVTAKLQIKRGDGGVKKSEPVKETPQPSTKSQNKEESSSPTTIPDKAISLKLDPLSLERLAQPKVQSEKKNATRSLERYQPFSRDTSANSELFRFRPGTPDFLPNIPDGELTLLNAKADKFAPFVRRVASQVFGIVRRLQWHNLPKSDVQKINEFTTVEAILSPEGKLLQVKLQDGSGSPAFDNLITESVRQGASDQNPPVGVLAEDGKIHFIFKSRSWTRPGPAGIPDARWLLLATGLL